MGSMEKQNGYYKTDVSDRFLHREIYYSKHPDTPRLWHVHHIDCDRTNNAMSNLIAVPADLHREIHKRMNAGEKFDKAKIEEELIGHQSTQDTKRCRCVNVVIEKPKIKNHEHFNLSDARKRELRLAISGYRGKNGFLRSISGWVKARGIEGLTQKQVQKVIQIMRPTWVYSAYGQKTILRKSDDTPRT